MSGRLAAGPTTTIVVADGRTLACDDVGDPAGGPVIYVHGSPDSRLARHPDDELAASVGVRLLAVDRPGFGDSSADPAGTVASFGRDVIALVDQLGIDRFSVLGWSAGGLSALAVAAVAPRRITRVGLAAALPPFAAYADPGVLDGANDGRRMLAEMGAEIGAEATAADLAPYLLPDPITQSLAREHLWEGADPVRRVELESVPGAIEALAAAMVHSVRGGPGGITRDLELQVLTPDIDLAMVECPVSLWYGTADTTAPPSFGRWYGDHLPNAELHILPGASHYLPLTRWAELLATLRPQTVLRANRGR